MFATAVRQLRYAVGVLRGERLPADSLTRLAADVVATRAQLGPLADTALLPGQQDTVDPDVQRGLLRRRLRATARRARDTTPYYWDLFATHPVDPAALDPDSWLDLPVTPKSALRGMPSAFTAHDVDAAVLALTTGTSGPPTEVWFSRDEIEMVVALDTIAAAATHGLGPGRTVAFAGSSRAIVPVLGLGRSVPATGAAYIHIGTIDPDVALDRLATPRGSAGRLRQVTHLVGTSSYLAALVSAGERGEWTPADFGLESIQVGGEILTDALRARARAVFGVEPVTSYLLTEAVPAGGTRCRAGHLHFGTEFTYFEVLDPVTFRPTAPGAVGTIVVTPLVPFRECTMLLRYVTGDLVRMPAEPVTCELAAVPATSDILGRYTGRASMLVSQRDILEVLEAESRVPLPSRYVLDDDNDLHVLVDDATPALRARLAEGLAGRGVPVGRVELHTDRGTLPRHTPVRADLREATFDRHTTARPVRTAA